MAYFSNIKKIKLAFLKWWQQKDYVAQHFKTSDICKCAFTVNEVCKLSGIPPFKKLKVNISAQPHTVIMHAQSHIKHTFFIIPAQKDRNVDSEPKSFRNSWRNLFPHFLLLPLWTQVNYCKCGTSCKVWRSLFAFDYTHLRNLWKFAFL